MRKSRLNFFKSTSMLISAVGVIMIIATIIVVAYIGFSTVSSGITNDISSGNQYDDLADLKSSYSDLESKMNSIKSMYSDSDSSHLEAYSNAQLELSRANSAIENAQSALDSGKSSHEVDSRLEYAQQQLLKAKEAYENL